MKHEIQANLSGKQCVITGASAGIGKELTRVLSGLGAEVTLACRDLAKARAVEAELKAENPNAKLRLEQLDVSRVDSINEFAERLAASTPKLDILLNNAGGWVMERRLTGDGFEQQWATNVLGPHLLTRLLAPSLGGGGRIVNVASTAAGGLDLADTQYETRKYGGVSAYSATKQALRMLSWSWAERLKPTGVMVNAMSPGLVNTELNRNAKGFFAVVFSITKLFGKTAADGADTAAWLAAAPELANETNQFWENRKSVPCKFRDDAQQARLFELCDQQIQARLARQKAA
jgi:NAD(P)-dependent dehydrogenase (short-subunit alcohol dehydrogenase family)